MTAIRLPDGRHALTVPVSFNVFPTRGAYMCTHCRCEVDAKGRNRRGVFHHCFRSPLRPGRIEWDDEAVDLFVRVDVEFRPGPEGFEEERTAATVMLSGVEGKDFNLTPEEWANALEAAHERMERR